MMKVVGEEGTAIDDFIVYLKAEFLDAVYLQQDAFDPVDARHARPSGSSYVFACVLASSARDFDFADKDAARGVLRPATSSSTATTPPDSDWNRTPDARSTSSCGRRRRRHWRSAPCSIGGEHEPA